MQKRAWVQAGAIVLLTLLAYLPALRAGFIWDDDYYITRNFSLRSGQGLIDLWLRPGVVPQYYPVTHTSFWLEYHLWRVQPAGYHAVNILLHAAIAILLWIILTRLEIPGAWLIAAIWALHPVNVESVAWVTERKNVLSGFLYLSALLTYLPLALIAENALRTHWKRYALTLALFSLALLSKSVTASLPAAILLIIWWKRGRIEVRDILPLLPMFAIGLVMAYKTSTMEKENVGAWGPDWTFSIADRFLIAGRAVWFYACKLLIPWRLTFIYPRWTIDPKLLWQWLFPLAAIALVATAIALRNRIGRAPAACLLFFGGTLVPALGFVNVYPMRYSFVADHFQYLACIGVIVLVIAAGRRWLTRPIPAAAILLVLGTVTFRHTFAYRDLRSLWLDTLAKNPSAWMARTNYAAILLADGNLAEADLQIRQALHDNRRNPEAIRNLAMLFEAQGNTDEAIQAYKSSIEMSGGQDAKAQFNLARLLLAMGDTRQGMFYLNRVLEFYPQYPPAHDEYARILFAQGQANEAVAELERAIALDPDMLSAQYHLINVLAELGHTPDNDPRLRELVQRLRAVLPTSRPTTQTK